MSLTQDIAELCLRHGIAREIVREVHVAGDTPVIPESGIDLWKTVRQFECGLIRQALERTGGNKARAARLLGLQRTTLVEKLKTLEWQAR